MNILVTGGTRGLGLEIVRQLLAADHRVFAVGRSSTSELEELDGDGKLVFIPYDLEQSQGIKEHLFDTAIGVDTPLHGVVNNAALAYDDLVSNLDLEQLQQLLQINVMSPMQVTKCAIRNMLLHKVAGSLVHISSVSAHTGYKGLAMYGASKGALESFSKNVAREWGSMGIRSNCVVPGFMETDMSSALSEDQKHRIYQRTALKRATQLGSVAAMVCFLLSDASCSVTGQNIFVDAGTI